MGKSFTKLADIFYSVVEKKKFLRKNKKATVITTSKGGGKQGHYKTLYALKGKYGLKPTKLKKAGGAHVVRVKTKNRAQELEFIKRLQGTKGKVVPGKDGKKVEFEETPVKKELKKAAADSRNDADTVLKHYPDINKDGKKDILDIVQTRQKIYDNPPNVYFPDGEGNLLDNWGNTPEEWDALSPEDRRSKSSQIDPKTGKLKKEGSYIPKKRWIEYGFHSEMNKIAGGASANRLIKQVKDALLNARGKREAKDIVMKAEKMIKKLPKKVQKQVNDGLQKFFDKKIRGGPWSTRKELTTMAKEPGYKRKYVSQGKNSPGWTAIDPKESKTVRGRYKNIMNQGWNESNLRQKGIKKKASYIMDKLSQEVKKPETLNFGDYGEGGGYTKEKWEKKLNFDPGSTTIDTLSYNNPGNYNLRFTGKKDGKDVAPWVTMKKSHPAQSDYQSDVEKYKQDVKNYDQRDMSDEEKLRASTDEMKKRLEDL